MSTDFHAGKEQMGEGWKAFDERFSYVKDYYQVLLPNGDCLLGGLTP